MTEHFWRCVFWLCIGLSLGASCHAGIIMIQPWPGGASGLQPILYWSMDETSGTTLDDSQGLSDGTTSDGIGVGGITSVAGSVGTAINFNNHTGLYAYTNTAAVWNTWPDSYTVYMKIKQSASGTDYAWCKTSRTGGATGTNMCSILIESNLKVSIDMRSNGSNLTKLTSSNALSSGNWSKVAIIITPSGRSVYVDSTVTSDAITSRPLDYDTGYSSDAMVLAVARIAGTNYNALGAAIDEFRLYDTALTEEQIDALP